MERLTEIIAFLFLGSLVFFSGLFLIVVHAELDLRGTLSNTNLNNLNNANAILSPSDTNVLTNTTSMSGTTASSTVSTNANNTNSLDAAQPANLNTNTTSASSSDTTLLSNNTNTTRTNSNTSLDANTNTTLQKNTNDGTLNTNTLDSTQSVTNVNTRTDTQGTGLKNKNDTVNVNATTNTTPTEQSEPSSAAGTANEFLNVNTAQPEGGLGSINQNISTNVSGGPVSGDEVQTPSDLQSDRPSSAAYAQYCLSFGIVDSKECQILLSLDLNSECRKERIITPEACENFLRQKYIASLCEQISPPDAPVGDENRACIEQLVDSFAKPMYCGSRTSDDCRRIAVQHVGQIIASDVQSDALSASLTSKLGTTTTAGEILSAIQTQNHPRETLPLDVEANKSLILRQSDQVIDLSNEVRAEVTAPYVLVYDDDNDGLPNDLEDHYHTDPADSDSDDDGYPDGTELINGYNPRQSGGSKIDPDLQPVEIAVLTKVPLEQPQTRGEVDQLFSVHAVQPAVSASGYIINGRAEPDSFVLMYVYSQMPLVLLVKTAEYDGRWTYELKDNLVDGKHTVYVAVTDDTGKITRKSNPFTFFVQKTQAVSASNFLRDQPITEFETKQNQQTVYYVIGGAGIVILGLGIFFAIYFSRRARHDYQEQ